MDPAILRVVVRADAVRAMPPAKAAWCCQHVCGLSVRLKLTLSYAGFLVLAGALLLALWVVLMRYFPHAGIISATRSGIGGAFVPGRSPTQRAFG